MRLYFLKTLNIKISVSISNPDSSLGTKRVARSEAGRVGVVGHNHHFVCSQKRDVSLTLQKFNKNRWRLLTALPLKILDNISGIGSGAGIAVSSHRIVL
jgi:hypothetical protein